MSGAAFEDRFITVADGLKLHLRDYSGGSAHPPLLCLHGLTRNVRDFTDFAERYSPRFRVTALDFRGRGDSENDPQPGRYTPLTYAADVIQILDQLAINEAIFVGTSLGGLVTMTVGAMQPQRIAATILNDVGPDLSTSGLDRIRAYVGKDARFRTWDDAAKAIAANQGPAFPAYQEAQWLDMAKRNCREDEGEIRFDYDMAIAVPFASSGAAPSIDLWPLFQTLAAKPVLVIRGEISDLLTAETAERMAAAGPNVTVATVPSVGHAPMLNEPAAVEAIDDFLDRLA